VLQGTLTRCSPGQFRAIPALPFTVSHSIAPTQH
jgi:hypothetical protein